jgi:hypothetical protein
VPRYFVDETSALCAGKSYDACFTILIASFVLLCVFHVFCCLLSVEFRGMVAYSSFACLPRLVPRAESKGEKRIEKGRRRG